ncbi:MAG TPA: hypothetical protein VFY71_07860 [Planctomycetota bacterium]|nr:hypothetical protein [Planctomycetota bacterium]
MRTALLASALLLATGCGALSPAPAAPGEPGLELRAAPDVRVLALDVQPQPGGWLLAAHFELPHPVLPSERTALIEGLDAAGTVLFAQAVELRLRTLPARFGEPRPATLRADLPAHAGLQSLRLTLAPAP